MGLRSSPLVNSFPRHTSTSFFLSPPTLYCLVSFFFPANIWTHTCSVSFSAATGCCRCCLDIAAATHIPRSLVFPPPSRKSLLQLLQLPCLQHRARELTQAAAEKHGLSCCCCFKYYLSGRAIYTCMLVSVAWLASHTRENWAPISLDLNIEYLHTEYYILRYLLNVFSFFKETKVLKEYIRS